jgi:hypothetical protein
MYPRVESSQRKTLSKDNNNPETVIISRRLLPKGIYHPKITTTHRQLNPKTITPLENHHPKQQLSEDSRSSETAISQDSYHPRIQQSKDGCNPKTAIPQRQLNPFMMANHHVRNYTAVPNTIADESIYQKDRGPPDGSNMRIRRTGRPKSSCVAPSREKTDPSDDESYLPPW